MQTNAAVMLPVGLKANWSLSRGLGKAGRKSLDTTSRLNNRDGLEVAGIEGKS
jgi:hypothetical protein